MLLLYNVAGGHELYNGRTYAFMRGIAYHRPGWAFVSTVGTTSGAGLLDLEVLVANTASGVV